MSGQENQTAMAADIVSAYVSNNSVPVSELAALITLVHSALLTVSIGEVAPIEEPAKEPAVPIKKSVTRDHIICLEDGKKFTSLRRHLASKFDMTPEAYRAKWGLPSDYPMVAPAYSEKRSALAKSAGLGRKRDAEKATKKPAKKAA